MRNAAKPAVLSVGRLYCDLIFTDLPRLPTLGTEVFGAGFSVHPGGGAFITAAHLSELGHASSLASMLPSSPFAELVSGDLEASRVDLSLSGTLPASSGPQITVAMVEGGDRAFLTRRAGPALPKLSAAELAKHDFRHLHIGELASLLAEPGIIALARKMGMTISVDCSWDDNLSPTDVSALAGKIDVFLPNEAEHEAIQRMLVGDRLAPITVIKRGAAGAVAITDAGTLSAPTKPRNAVDTTGAGDAFNAGFLSVWLEGGDLRRCLAAGNSQGAKAIQQRGGFCPAEGQPSEFGVAGE